MKTNLIKINERRIDGENYGMNGVASDSVWFLGLHPADTPDYPQRPVTLLVALRGSDGIVVASDSRGTFGDPRGVTAQNDAQKKLYKASKHAAILTAGSGELGATVMAEALTLIQDSDGVSVVLEKTRNLVRQRYNEWFTRFALQPNPVGNPIRPDLGLLIAGYDVQTDAPAVQKIFQLQSGLDFAPMLHNYGFALLGVAQYALYLLNRLYQNDSSVDLLKPLAAYAITETASQDGKVGGPVQMAVITAEDGCVELAQGEIDAIVTSNGLKNTNLRDSFFKIKSNDTRNPESNNS